MGIYCETVSKMAFQDYFQLKVFLLGFDLDI